MALTRSWIAERNHDAYLFPALRDALDCLGNAALDTIIVGSGPGSYGGVRVAIAAATGIAIVRKARIATLCSWIPLAEDSCSILSDAKRGGWTLRRPDGTISVLTVAEVQQLIAEGADIRSVESADTLLRAGIILPVCDLQPTAEALTRTWLSMSDTEQQEALSHPPEPIYVRPPHITAPKRKPWETC